MPNKIPDDYWQNRDPNGLTIGSPGSSKRGDPGDCAYGQGGPLPSAASAKSTEGGTYPFTGQGFIPRGGAGSTRGGYGQQQSSLRPEDPGFSVLSGPNGRHGDVGYFGPALGSLADPRNAPYTDPPQTGYYGSQRSDLMPPPPPPDGQRRSSQIPSTKHPQSGPANPFPQGQYHQRPQVSINPYKSAQSADSLQGGTVCVDPSLLFQRK